MQSISTTPIRLATAAGRRRRRASRRPGPRRWPAAGLGADDVARRDGRVWLRITGHGADGERATGWRSATTPRSPAAWSAAATTRPVFCGDAIADPLTGLEAALAVRAVAAPRRRRNDRGVDGRGRRHATPRMTAPTETRCTATSAARRRRPRHSGADNAAVERLLAERRSGVMLIQRAVPAGRHRDRHPRRRADRRGRRSAGHRATGEEVFDAAGGPSSRACTITMSICARPPRR